MIGVMVVSRKSKVMFSVIGFGLLVLGEGWSLGLG